MKKALILVILLVFPVSGCGYSTRSLLSPHLRTVYIAPFRSNIDITKELEYGDHYRIYRPGLEREVTDEVKDRFVFDGNLKVVNTKEKADSLLEGKIVDFRKEPLQYREDRSVEEFRIKIIIHMKYTDLVKGKVVIEETSFVGEDTYTRSGAFAQSESSAQTDAITDLARRVVERIIEDW